MTSPERTAVLATTEAPAMPPQVATGELSVLAIIAMAAKDPSIDVAKMSALMDLKERIDAREAEREFTRAFAAASLELPRILKGGVIDMGSKGQIPFARYEDLDMVLRPIEIHHGFMRSFSTQPATEPGILMTLTLAHTGGHKITSTRFMPPDPGPGRNAMQAIGSASSYAKRYLTLDAWNIVTTGADDDGKTAGQQNTLSEAQVNQVLDLLLACNIEAGSTHMKGFLSFAGASRIEAIPQNRFAEVIAKLKQKAAKIQEGA